MELRLLAEALQLLKFSKEVLLHLVLGTLGLLEEASPARSRPPLDGRR